MDADACVCDRQVAYDKFTVVSESVPLPAAIRASVDEDNVIATLVAGRGTLVRGGNRGQCCALTTALLQAPHTRVHGAMGASHCSLHDRSSLLSGEMVATSSCRRCW